MKWNNHNRLRDAHSFLSPSQHQWLRYDDDKLRQVFYNKRAAAIGTERHAFAAKAIELGIKLHYEEGDTLALYVNECIDEGMTPEVILYENDFAFGTADAIYFDEYSMTLKIYDLKTGAGSVVKYDEAGFCVLEQCEIYAAIFCLEYGYNPNKLNMELRIYQNGQRYDEIPSADKILTIMHNIRHKSDILYALKGEFRP